VVVAVEWVATADLAAADPHADRPSAATAPNMAKRFMPIETF
jgi:hypothetical protein